MAVLISDFKAIVLGTKKVLVRDGTATLNFGGLTSTPVMSGQEMIGVTVQGVAAELSITCAAEAGTKVNETFTFRNLDIRLILDTGDEWLMRGSTNTEPPSFAGGGGEFSVTYTGKAIVEV